MEAGYQLCLSELVWLWEILLISLSKAVKLYIEVSMCVHACDVHACVCRHMWAGGWDWKGCTNRILNGTYYLTWELLKKNVFRAKNKTLLSKGVTMIRESWGGVDEGGKLGGAKFRPAVNLVRSFRWPLQIHGASSPHLTWRQILGLKEATLAVSMTVFLKQISEGGKQNGKEIKFEQLFRLTLGSRRRHAWV